LLQTFADYTELSHDFFFQIVPYFTSYPIASGETLWAQGDSPDGLFLIESGSLRATYAYADHTELVQETMVAGTVAGDLSMLSDTQRNATVVAERDAQLWKMDQAQLEQLEKDKPEVARAFVKIVLKGAVAFLFRKLIAVVAEEADVLSSHLIAVLS
jgi:SulP family sulfate permease